MARKKLAVSPSVPFADFPANAVNYLAHQRISHFLKIILGLGAILLLFQGRYQSAFEASVILFITFLPVLLGNRFQVRIPHEFESLAVVFVYLSLFLGGVQEFYARFWWWDMLLHLGSGFLLGVLGFLLVYVLNEKQGAKMSLHPKFIAFFALVFAMAMGAVWEIFEFGMDQLLGRNMQLGSLTDTMGDLIVDTLGAFGIAILGWKYLGTSDGDSFLERWINSFIEKNPRMFRRKKH